MSVIFLEMHQKLKWIRDDREMSRGMNGVIKQF